ncbi:MAG: hypothetical protein ABMA25_29440, partial [Ilumatobacteraceae bacterium]
MRTATFTMRAVCAALALGALVAQAVPTQSSVPRRPVAAADVTDLTSSAGATSPAARTKGPQPATTCQQVAFNVGLDHPGVTQVIVVLTT